MIVTYRSKNVNDLNEKELKKLLNELIKYLCASDKGYRILECVGLEIEDE